jgi:hypothetical protein
LIEIIVKQTCIYISNSSIAITGIEGVKLGKPSRKGGILLHLAVDICEKFKG